MIFVTSPPAWFIVSATACRPPRAAAEDQFLPVNHAAPSAVSNSTLCAEGRAISRAPFTSRMAAMSLGIYYWGARSCLPQANFSGDEEE